MLLRELANASQISDAILSAQATPLLHALSAAHAYITMFTHVCKVGQVRNFISGFRTSGHTENITNVRMSVL